MDNLVWGKNPEENVTPKIGKTYHLKLKMHIASGTIKVKTVVRGKEVEKDEQWSLVAYADGSGIQLRVKDRVIEYATEDIIKDCLDNGFPIKH